MRLFISLNVPAELHNHCRKLQNRFPGMKNVDEFHLTIQFLGDHIHEQFLPRITEALEKIEFKPFTLKLGEARSFPNEDRPHGVWIDCDGGKELTDLADRIRKTMDKIGFRPDKPFAAHITLGRYKTPPLPAFRPRGGRPQPTPNTDSRLRGNERIGFKVDRFFLMQSHLGPEGPSHKTLGEFKAR